MTGSILDLIVRAAIIIGAWAAVASAFWTVRRLLRWLRTRLVKAQRALGDDASRRTHRLKRLTLLQLRGGLAVAEKGLLLVLAVILIPFAVATTLRQFPATEHAADVAVEVLRAPFVLLWEGFVAYLPNLAFLVVWTAVIVYVIRALGVANRWIKNGLFVIPGFHAEWSEPTYRIMVFLLIAFALVVGFPYMPGGQSPAFQGVSIFLGVLISLGSGSVMGNIVSGIVLTYTRAFRVGDRVRIGDHVGDVLEKSAFGTRLRTIKNEEIFVPNSSVLSTSITNFTESRQAGGLILHTTVTIGYDAPWRKVHELLIEAARRTPDVLAEPAPFVFQTALGDFSVAYQINAYTDQANRASGTYSALHANIQDTFNEGGIEILSPMYNAVRDGNQTTTPASYLDSSYRKPGFRLEREP